MTIDQTLLTHHHARKHNHTRLLELFNMEFCMWFIVTDRRYDTNDVQLDVLKIPKDSPLQNAHSLFWGIRTNDEGTGRKDGFHAFVNQGKIKLVAPSKANGYPSDGESIVLRDGRTLRADAVILATGFSSSWTGIFTGMSLISSCFQCLCLPQKKLSKSSV
jgi:hypothetical protein